MAGERMGTCTGKVVKIGAASQYGFIASDALPDQDIYFKMSWFRDVPPLRVGDEVTFQLRMFDGQQGPMAQAHHLERVGGSMRHAGPAPAASTRPRGVPPSSYKILDWAYLGYLPNVLGELAGLALHVNWSFKNTSPNPDKPHPILWNYLVHTFGRLVRENKVIVSADKSWAAFNTGLVDPRYEPIHALFSQNDHPRIPWQLAGFCIPGEGAVGQNLVRHFAPLPGSAHYFDDLDEMIYDVRRGSPEMDWRHIVIENIERYPAEFLQDHWPSSFAHRDESLISPNERTGYFRDLGAAVEADNKVYRRIMNRMKDAVDLSIKRVSWNFKTAVPQYYPRVKKLQLLLPICLASDDKPDLALAVERTASGNYLGHTVLTLDWAYMNARLICRPDSDWLAPGNIDETGNDEEQN